MPDIDPFEEPARLSGTHRRSTVGAAMLSGEFSVLSPTTRAANRRAAIVFGFLFAADLIIGEQPRALKGPEIMARFPEHELLGAGHGRLIFSAAGSLIPVSIGGDMGMGESDLRIGSWYVTDDELCLEVGRGGPQCYGVWAWRSNVQLRREGERLHDGVLQKLRRRRVTPPA